MKHKPLYLAVGDNVITLQVANCENGGLVARKGKGTDSDAIRAWAPNRRTLESEARKVVSIHFGKTPVALVADAKCAPFWIACGKGRPIKIKVGRDRFGNLAGVPTRRKLGHVRLGGPHRRELIGTFKKYFSHQKGTPARQIPCPGTR